MSWNKMVTHVFWRRTKCNVTEVLITAPVTTPPPHSCIWAKTWDHLAVRHEGSSSTIVLHLPSTWECVCVCGCVCVCVCVLSRSISCLGFSRLHTAAEGRPLDDYHSWRYNELIWFHVAHARTHPRVRDVRSSPREHRLKRQGGSREVTGMNCVQLL